jgi:hypothetical protein
MKHRFEGPDGLPLLIESLMKQDLVEHDRSFAGTLASVGELIWVWLLCDDEQNTQNQHFDFGGGCGNRGKRPGYENIPGFTIGDETIE